MAIEAGQSLKGDDVVRMRTLNRLKLEHGTPRVLFCDNGAEFTRRILMRRKGSLSMDFVGSYDSYTISGRASAEGWWSFCNARSWVLGGFV